MAKPAASRDCERGRQLLLDLFIDDDSRLNGEGAELGCCSARKPFNGIAPLTATPPLRLGATMAASSDSRLFQVVSDVVFSGVVDLNQYLSIDCSAIDSELILV